MSDNNSQHYPFKVVGEILHDDIYGSILYYGFLFERVSCPSFAYADDLIEFAENQLAEVFGAWVYYEVANVRWIKNGEHMQGHQDDLFHEGFDAFYLTLRAKDLDSANPDHGYVFDDLDTVWGEEKT